MPLGPDHLATIYGGIPRKVWVSSLTERLMKSRGEAREELLTEIGLLEDPIRRLVFGDEDPRPRIPYVRSQFYRDLEPFQARVTAFCRPDNYRFETELDGIVRETHGFAEFLARGQWPKQMKKIRDAVRAVPCDNPGCILPSESPYRTYLRLRALRGAAKICSSLSRSALALLVSLRL
jgi:hypothetical protein